MSLASGRKGGPLGGPLVSMALLLLTCQRRQQLGWLAAGLPQKVLHRGFASLATSLKVSSLQPVSCLTSISCNNHLVRVLSCVLVFVWFGLYLSEGPQSGLGKLALN